MILDRVMRTVRLLAAGRFDYFSHAMWVRAKGLDFSPASLEELGLREERSVHHSASSGAYLREVLGELEIPPGSKAMDLGSGKGAALCILAEFPFDEVVGVEISRQLVAVAQANVYQLGFKNVRLVCCDAGEFNEYDGITHLYMFNPFPEVVAREVIKNLAGSLARRSRAFTLIYYYPTCHELLMESGLFQPPQVKNFPYSHPWNIYQHHPS